MFGLGRQKVAIATNPGFGSADLVGQIASAFFARRSRSIRSPSSSTTPLAQFSSPSSSFDVPKPVGSLLLSPQPEPFQFPILLGKSVRSPSDCAS